MAMPLELFAYPVLCLIFNDLFSGMSLLALIGLVGIESLIFTYGAYGRSKMIFIQGLLQCFLSVIFILGGIWLLQTVGQPGFFK